MRNIFQTMIDQAVRDGRLVALDVVIADFSHSLRDAWIDAPNDLPREEMLKTLTTETKEAKALVDELAGYGRRS